MKDTLILWASEIEIFAGYQINHQYTCRVSIGWKFIMSCSYIETHIHEYLIPNVTQITSVSFGQSQNDIRLNVCVRHVRGLLTINVRKFWRLLLTYSIGAMYVLTYKYWCLQHLGSLKHVYRNLVAHNSPLNRVWEREYSITAYKPRCTLSNIILYYKRFDINFHCQHCDIGA